MKTVWRHKKDLAEARQGRLETEFPGSPNGNRTRIAAIFYP
jgi:hypothetical protein